MGEVTGRYPAGVHAAAAEGWTLRQITPPSRLHGAAGLRAGADGRIYVAQVPGSQMIPFSGIAIAADGAIYFSGDAEGSVQEIRTQ